jgi:hypothetical protein
VHQKLKLCTKINTCSDAAMHLTMLTALLCSTWACNVHSLQVFQTGFMPRCSASVRLCTARGEASRVVMSAVSPADLATFVREAKEGLGVTMSNCNAAVVNGLRGRFN